jgi:hypothetical protein
MLDRYHKILQNLSETLIASQKTHKEQKINQSNEKNSKAAGCKLTAGDKVRNINTACMHYGSEGVVETVIGLPEDHNWTVGYQTTNSGKTWDVGQVLTKTDDQLQKLELYPNPVSLTSNEDEEENETPEQELDEYKEDFFEMSVGSLRAIATHAQEILNSLENPRVKENLTESWLQGKIAVTEDYMRTIHDFIMYVSESADNISAADRPGLWENIRKKREREGKKYKPAKPGDKDRPDPEQWKKLTK